MLVDILHHYVSLGYPIFPLKPGTKKPLGRLVPNGLKQATFDVGAIEQWIAEAPDANWGIVPPERVLVLDFDDLEQWRVFQSEYPVLTQAPRQRTPSGGVHVFLQVPERVIGELSATTRAIPGVHIRGLGRAYLVAEPSEVDGKAYRWEAPLLPPADLPEVPAELLALLTPPPPPPVPAPTPTSTQTNGHQQKRVKALLAWGCERVAAAQEGTRHNTLLATARLVGGWLHHGLEEAYALECLTYAGVQAGLPDDEAHNTARDGLEYGKLLPMPLPADDNPPTTLSADAWPEIIPLDLGAVPEFPTHALPDVLREWVEAESRATQTPPDLCGLLTLAVCSACIARRVEVEGHPGWREPVNLFVAVLLEPANRKSTVFADTVRPLRDVEKAWIEDVRPEIARAESSRRRDEARLRKLEKQAGEKGDIQASAEAGDLAAKLATEPLPVLPRLIVDDITPEKLALLLEKQGGRLASFATEGSPFDIMAGLYTNGTPQFNVYSKSHSGDTLNEERIGRPGVHVEKPTLTCGYAIQPSVIRRLAEKPAFRDRGLLGRFLYAVPRSWVGEREIAPPPVPDAVRENYHKLVHRMAEGLREPCNDPFVLRLTPEAEAMLCEWEREIESMLGDGGELEAMRDWGGKLAGATLRIAGVLHCAMHGIAGSIAASTLEAAITIGRYLIPHAERVLYAAEVSGGGILDDARYLLRWIKRSGKREFSKSEAQQNTKRRFPRVDDIEPALGELVNRGYIRLKILPKQDAKSPGRPPSPVFEVNPELSLPTGGKHDFETPEVRPKKPKNSFAVNFQVFQGASGGVENHANPLSVGENELSDAPTDLSRHTPQEQGDSAAPPESAIPPPPAEVSPAVDGQSVSPPLTGGVSGTQSSGLHGDELANQAADEADAEGGRPWEF